MKISFFKVIEKLEEMAKDEDLAIADYAKDLLKEVALHPELKDGFEDHSMLEKLKRPIQRICRALFPDALMTNEIKALTSPFYFKPIYASTRFNNITKDSGEDFLHHMSAIDDDTFYLYCCYYILGAYYKYPVYAGGNLKVDIFNKQQSLNRTYKLAINADLTEFIPTEKALDISEQEFEELLDNFGDIKVWKKKFPPNSWIMKGVNIINLMDITVDQSMSSITSNLLNKSDDSFDKIKNQIRQLYNSSTLEIGAISLKGNMIKNLGKDDVSSIVISKNESFDCMSAMCNYTHDVLINKKEPLIIPDVEKFHSKSQSPISKSLVEAKLKSYVMAPLIHNEELLGFIELGSYKRYELNSVSIKQLTEVVPIISIAHKRYITEEQNNIEAIIQRECTTIHPSVKWRFEEAAVKFMHMQKTEEHPAFKDITFGQLYPLYGQMDIRNSSSKRNEAVKVDLSKQIKLVRKVLHYALKQSFMPAYEELIFQIDQHSKKLEEGLAAGSEHSILEFLKNEVYPVFRHLENKGPALQKMVSDYNNALDTELHSVYEERKKYDQSVNLINQRLASYIDKQQEEAQTMYPHYFERYKTDGIEYNMYIGQSINPYEPFDQVYLRNLRLWQLIVMCDVETEFKRLQQELNTTIEIASLILVYNTPISIHFRMDEKRFDVEGAYNARYEVLKKRVDKAHIKGTKERITQPGHIAIIYSQKHDADEYKKYLAFLAAKGLIKSEIEDHYLEDLQGVSGLKALRVKVTYQNKFSIDEFIESIEKDSKTTSAQVHKT